MIKVEKEVADNSCCFYFVLYDLKKPILCLSSDKMIKVEEIEKVRIMLENYFNDIPLFLWENSFETTLKKSITMIYKLIVEIKSLKEPEIKYES